MERELRNRLRISENQLARINALLLDPHTQAINDFLQVIDKHGTVDEINAKANDARKLPNLMNRLKEEGSPYLADLEWLLEQRDASSLHQHRGLPPQSARRQSRHYDVHG